MESGEWRRSRPNAWAEYAMLTNATSLWDIGKGIWLNHYSDAFPNAIPIKVSPSTNPFKVMQIFQYVKQTFSTIFENKKLSYCPQESTSAKAETHAINHPRK